MMKQGREYYEKLAELADLHPSNHEIHKRPEVIIAKQDRMARLKAGHQIKKHNIKLTSKF